MAKLVKHPVVVLFFCTFCWYGEVAIAENSTMCNQAQYDYKDVLGKAILFFEGQRSGELPANQRVKWRGNSALIDGKSANVNLAGGYYDAGDNIKFGWPMAFTTTLLSWTAIEHPSELSSAKQIGYLRGTIRWASDFLSRCHPSSNILYTQVGDATQDHQCWERPEDMDTPRTLYKITSSSPGTEAAADYAAALASASIVFKKVNPKYSGSLLNQAQSLFEFADKYRESYTASCPFYCSYNGYQDELLWAAAWLYKASGAAKYLAYVSSNKGWSQSVTEFSWDNKYAGVQVLLAKEFIAGKQDLSNYKSSSDSFVCSVTPGSSSLQVHTTPGGLLFTRDEANLQYATGATMLLSIYAKALAAANVAGVQCGSTNISPSQIQTFVKSQVDYILGKNPMKMSYMVGFGTKFPLQLHHRGSSIPSIKRQPAKVNCTQGYKSWYDINKANPNVHTGAIVGGPEYNDHFSDVRADHTHLEPTTYMNAAFVGTVASLVPKASCSNLKLSDANQTTNSAKTT